MMFYMITALSREMEVKYMLALEQVGWYEAPPGKVTPRVIPSGFQLIEVITGGQVRFLFNGIDHLCTCGSILWHVPGERTVHRSNPADPYRCATFLFRCSDTDERPVSRFSIWPEPAEAVRFCREALQASHTEGVDYALLGDYCRTVLHWKACSWAAANAAMTRAVGDYYFGKLEHPADRFPNLISGIEGKRHLAGLAFRALDPARAFVRHMTDAGLDISVQTYKEGCPPIALTKLPLIMDYNVIDFIISAMKDALSNI